MSVGKEPAVLSLMVVSQMSQSSHNTPICLRFCSKSCLPCTFHHLSADGLHCKRPSYSVWTVSPMIVTIDVGPETIPNISTSKAGTQRIANFSTAVSDDQNMQGTGKLSALLLSTFSNVDNGQIALVPSDVTFLIILIAYFVSGIPCTFSSWVRVSCGGMDAVMACRILADRCQNATLCVTMTVKEH